MPKSSKPPRPGPLRFEPDRDGLEAVMGPLEAKIMESLWDRGGATVREVWEDLGGEAKAAYTTVMTVVHRLHEKGYLTRTAQGRAHRYQPTESRPEFQGGVLSRVLGGVLGQLRAGRPLGVVDRLSKRDRALLRKMLDDAEGQA